MTLLTNTVCIGEANDTGMSSHHWENIFIKGPPLFVVRTSLKRQFKLRTNSFDGSYRRSVYVTLTSYCIISMAMVTSHLSANDKPVIAC